MTKILCWLWHQDRGRTAYTAEHVNVWAAMVRRHLTLPHTLACVTDTPEGIDPGVEIIPPPGDFEDVVIPSWSGSKPRCHRRLALFRPDAADVFGAERLVSMDLDCVVSGSLDPVLDRPEDFVVFRGTSRSRPRPYNGSLIMLTAGARPRVYTEFTPKRAAEAGRRFVGSDQSWISHILGWGEATFGEEHGVHWWRAGQSRDGVRLMFFPGLTKPWSLVGRDPWVNAHYWRDAPNPPPMERPPAHRPPLRYRARPRPEIDLTLTATRRGEPLRAALASLDRHLFPHFDVRDVFVNIDPVFGDDDVRPLLAGLPGHVCITEPDVADHAAAIKTTWGATRRGVVLHWEDDYELLEDVTPQRILPLLTGQVGVMPIWHDERRPKVSVRPEWRWRSAHGTSPRFMTGDMARGMARLLVDGLCPEKQVAGARQGQKPVNEEAHGFALGFRGQYILPQNGAILARHLGAAWNEAHGITRRVEGGRCIRAGL